MLLHDEKGNVSRGVQLTAGGVRLTAAGLRRPARSMHLTRHVVALQPAGAVAY